MTPRERSLKSSLLAAWPCAMLTEKLELLRLELLDLWRQTPSLYPHEFASLITSRHVRRIYKYDDLSSARHKSASNMQAD